MLLVSRWRNRVAIASAALDATGVWPFHRCVPNPKRVFITVAERSADDHAANLVRALRTLDSTIEVHAHGGDALRSAGAIVHHDTVSKAAMGLAAFKRYGEIKRVLRETAAFYRANKPDLHICCDSWTMNVHFARLAKSFGVPVLYYIAPQAWASREGRVRQLAEVADALACILPFEERFFRDRGVNATFVGHPLFDAMSSEHIIATTAADPAAFPTVALACGSRRGIVRKNFGRQLDVAKQILDAFPATRFLVPTTRTTHPLVETMLGQRPDLSPRVTAEPEAFDELIPRCDLAITVSGTATLHIAAHGVPMLIVYYVNPTAWNLIGRHLVKVRTFGLINILAAGGPDRPARHVAQEFIPWNGSIDPVANAAIELLRDRSKLRTQREASGEVISTISKPGASMNAARIAFDLMGRGAPS